MNDSTTCMDLPLPQKGTVGQVLLMLRTYYRPKVADLAKALRTSTATYTKIERDERDLSLIMAVKLCGFYGITLGELLALVNEEGLQRKDVSGIRAEAIRRRHQAALEAIRAKIIPFPVPGID